jgi:hypothetical protein
MQEVAMRIKSTPDHGFKNLITNYRRAFRIPENPNHYSEHDLKNAERCFIKYMRQKESLSDATSLPPVPQ